MGFGSTFGRKMSGRCKQYAIRSTYNLVTPKKSTKKKKKS